jgi:hypothetical protein
MHEERCMLFLGLYPDELCIVGTGPLSCSAVSGRATCPLIVARERVSFFKAAAVRPAEGPRVRAGPAGGASESFAAGKSVLERRKTTRTRLRCH